MFTRVTFTRARQKTADPQLEKLAALARPVKLAVSVAGKQEQLIGPVLQPVRPSPDLDRTRAPLFFLFLSAPPAAFYFTRTGEPESRRIIFILHAPKKNGREGDKKMTA